MEVNQQELRQLEMLCTQEMPPAAMAWCPLHVDCRGICQAIAHGDFKEARSLYEKAVAFPEILSRCCSQSCQEACVRKERGGSLAMGSLELAALTYGDKKVKRTFLSKKSQKAAVIGGGLSGMTAALELAKKGYPVTLYEAADKLGGYLRVHGEGTLLNEEVWAEAQCRLNSLGVTIKLDSAGSPEELLASFELVCVCWGEKEPLSTDAYYQVGDSAVFAAGMAANNGTAKTPEMAIAEGKGCALSGERYLKKVLISAGREYQGSFVTPLYVNDKEIEPKESKVADRRETVLTREEAMEEASRCIQCECMECTKGCAFMRYYKSYPKKYAREIYNNLSIAMGTRHANKMINSCNLCGQCKVVCPNGLDLGKTIQNARQIMVEKEKMPASAFEFAMLDLEHSNGEESAYLAHAPGMEESRYLLFPGCQLGASAPEVVMDLYGDLLKRYDTSIGIWIRCCSITARWAGQEEWFQRELNKMREEWHQMGEPILILACPTCYDTFHQFLPEIPLKGVWEVLEEIGLPKVYLETPRRQGLVVHDACGARSHEEIRTSIRRLAESMGLSVGEKSRFSQEATACCGFGGLVPCSNPEVADAVTAQATEEKKEYLTYCMNCRDRFVRQESSAAHILELLYEPEDAFMRSYPSSSRRRDNRFFLKQKLRAEYWKEEVEEVEQIPLYYSEEMAALLEERKILEQDIRQAICEGAKNQIQEASSGLTILHHRIGNVTFWVYYREHEDGYYIEKAYSHRMYIKGE